MNKNTTCFFTGHRDIPVDRYDIIYNDVEKKLEQLYDIGYRNFICGGAVGFDTLAADAVIQLKGKHTDVTLHLCLPCADQTKYFSDEQKTQYDRILRLCDSSETLFQSYVRGCMHARNRKMADSASYCIAYCIKPTGGSAYTVKYARSRGVSIFFVK